MTMSRNSLKTPVAIVANRVLVSGQVQGVGYRYALSDRAQALNVTGWCRNLPDGRVEAFLQGPAPAMAELLDWMQTGPGQATVEDVQVERQAVLEPLLGESIQAFEIRK